MVSNCVDAAAPCATEVTCETPVLMFTKATRVSSWLPPSPVFLTIAATRPFGLIAISFPPSGKRLTGLRSAFHTTVGPRPGGVVTSERPSGENAIANDASGAT